MYERFDLARPGVMAHLALVDLDETTTWQERAVCAQTDPEAFFPEAGESQVDAKAQCRTCPVRVDCLDEALRNDERFGIWGGLSIGERRALDRADYSRAELAALLAETDAVVEAKRIARSEATAARSRARAGQPRRRRGAA